MIITEVFYGVKCDRCGEIYEDSEHSFYSDEDSAQQNALDDEWGELNGKHYCPNCHIIDEEKDEVKPFAPFPNHVKLIRKFFSSVVKSVRESIDESKEGIITLKYRLLYDEGLRPYDEEYLRNCLKDDFIDLVQTKELRHQTQISISIKV